MTAAPRPQGLDRASPTPLWAQLVTQLRGRLDSGEFPDRFPTEHELAATYAVSRHTVREALRQLRQEGRVTAQRGRGSHVTRSLVDLPMGSLYSLFRVLERNGVDQRSEVLVQEQTADQGAAARLGLPADAALVHLERLRLADGSPFAIDRAWLPADLAGPLLTADLRHTALYDELARRCQIRPEAGWERIRAAVPSDAQRRSLQLPRGSAVLRVERLSCYLGRSVEWRDTLVRGDRYNLTVEWGPAAVTRVDLHATIHPGQAG